jgi:hypothetical protein
MQGKGKSGNNRIFATKILILTLFFLRHVSNEILVVGASGGNPERLFSFSPPYFQPLKFQCYVKE